MIESVFRPERFTTPYKSFQTIEIAFFELK